jgi:benzylsuccinate CoA-transferase BbsF subunit
MWQTGYEGEGPLGPGTHFPDHAANPYHAAFAVLAALRHRRRTGRGLKIDLAQVESTINCMGIPFLDYAASGTERERHGNRSPFHAPHNVFRCAGDDEWCAIAVLDDEQWRALVEVIGDSSLQSDLSLKSAAGRLQQVDRIEAAVANWTRDRTAVSVMQLLQEHGIPAGVVASAKFLMEDDAQLRDRGYWQVIDHPEIGPARFTSPPYRLDDARVELKRPPLFSEHTDSVLADLLGYSSERIAELRAGGVLE